MHDQRDLSATEEMWGTIFLQSVKIISRFLVILAIL